MSSQEEKPVLSASMHDLRHFAALLRGVNFSNRATINATNNGFTVMVEEARALLATAYVFSNIFDEYNFDPSSLPASQTPQEDDAEASPTPLVFEIPLNTLLDCLNIFGTASASATTSSKLRRWKDDAGETEREDGPATSIGTTGTGMRLVYGRVGEPLTLIISEEAGGPTARCDITTYDPEPHLELPYDNDETVLKIILKSSWLRDALSELDSSCEKVTFIGTPSPDGPTRARRLATPSFRIRAKGMFGSTEIDYPDDREVLENFECARPISVSYRFAHISRTIRALTSSTKTSLRIDDQGLLSLQFLMPAPRSQRVVSTEAFIEFRCLPVDDDG